MILLDSDHFSRFRHAEDAAGQALRRRLEAAGEEACLPVVVAEEALRGWLGAIAKVRAEENRSGPYRSLRDLLERLGQWRIIDYDDTATLHFRRLRKQRVRIGSSDLRIASIALSLSALLLTANLRDFHLVSGLRAENWLSA